MLDSLHTISNRIKHRYNRVADTYANNAALQYHVADNMADDLLLFALKPSLIIDAGCSTGFLTRKMHKHFSEAQVVGVDFAESMCIEASNSHNDDNPCYINADVNCLPFADATVDIVASNFLLHWLLDLPNFLHESNRVLKSNGLIFFSTLGVNSLQELREAWLKCDDVPHINQFMEMHNIGDLLIKNQFSQPIIHQEVITLTYTDTNKLWQDLKLVGANTVLFGNKTLMGKHRWQRLNDAIVSMYKDGKFSLSFEIVYGHAWKGQEVFKGPNRDKSNVIEITLEQLKRDTSITRDGSVS